MQTKYMNPYLAGFLLGLLLVATVYITGRGLGASGAIKSITVEAVTSVAPEHAADTKFFQEYTDAHAGSALKSWLVFEVVGVLIGAFISGLVSDRLNFTLEHGPKIKSGVRIFGAMTGGLLFGFGAQLGRGCTSGAALSGMAVLSTGGILTMVAIFGGAYAFAYFFRKLWL
ncbi:MAG: YeeE/YedE family protein [Ignavibacteriales bacterium]|nr:YeeE/YedE family protein [Ignavibacteriota bacterium]MCB9247798.1 YeeE/YedE family protein [Ignavibacteriales bacterium]